MLFQKVFGFLAALWISGSHCAKQISCGNAGLQYAVFSNAQAYNTYDPVAPKDPSVGGQGPRSVIYSSTTTRLGGNIGYCPGNFSLYGSPNVIPCERHAIMLRGYIFAPVSGVYTIAANDVDNVIMLWTNTTALSGWNGTNAAMTALWNKPWPTQTGTSDGNNATFLYLKQGQYYAIRLLHVNSGGPMAALISIFDPLGNILMGANTPSSPSIVQYSCDGSAGAFPYNRGQEL